MNYRLEHYNGHNYSTQEHPLVLNLRKNALTFAQQIAKIDFSDGRILPLGGGHMNEVFLLEVYNSRKVLKMHPFDRLAIGEAFLLDQWKKLGVPVPEVLEANFTKSLIPYSYLIMEYVTTTDEKFEDCLVTDQRRLLTSVVQYLQTAHQVKENQYGWINFHTDRKGDSSWAQTVNNIIIGRGQRLCQIGLLDMQALNLFKNKIIKKMQDISISSLLHGDCIMSNILFNNGEIAAIIDPDPIGGDGLYDVAYLSTCIPALLDSDYDNLLIQSYLGKDPSQAEFDRWHIYKVLSLIRQINGAIKKNPDDPNIQIKTQKCKN